MKRTLYLQSDELRILTDVPSEVIELPQGFLDFETSCNVVVQRITNHLVLPPAQTRLAIRSVFGGERRFEIEDHPIVVDDSNYLILNQGQFVSSSVLTQFPVECFNVTFKPEFAEQVLNTLITPADRLLDAPPNARTIQPVEFMVRSYPHAAPISPILDQMRAVMAEEQVTPGWLEEKFHDLLEAMLVVHRNVAEEIDRIPAVRPATRIELYQRLHRARDFIESSLSQNITLEDISRAAYISPHHLLRLFKQVFHATPHQYLTQLRLRRAQHLLKTTNLQITEICFMVGFESLGSFSWLFRQHFGMPPSYYRSDRSSTSTHRSDEEASLQEPPE